VCALRSASRPRVRECAGPCPVRPCSRRSRRPKSALSAPAAIASEFQRAALAAFANRTRARAALHDQSTGRWLDALIYPSSDGLLAIIADVTSAKRSELELAAHADYLQQLVDQIPAFLWVIDRNLVVRRIEGGRPMLEALDRDRLIGLSMADVTSMGSNQKDLELSVDMHRRVLQGVPGQYRATWKGITLEARIRPLRDRDGDIVGILGVGIDVTEQTRMEEQLRGSEERFRAVVEGSTDLIAILDDDLRVTYASRSQGRVLGYRASDGPTIDPWSLIHADDLDYAREQFATLGRRAACACRVPFGFGRSAANGGTSSSHSPTCDILVPSAESS
jgi:PAS domain S-box-containing protein